MPRRKKWRKDPKCCICQKPIRDNQVVDLIVADPQDLLCHATCKDKLDRES